MTTHRIRVPRRARCEVLEARPGAGVDGTLWALHGYGQLAPDFAQSFAPLTEQGVRVIAPEALSRFYLGGGSGRIGASWMTREERDEEISDYVVCLDAWRETLPPLGPELVLGFSQGAATAFRWSVLGSVRPRRIVLTGGGVPPDTDWKHARERLAETEVVLVAGRGDRSFDPARAEESRQALLDHGCEARVIVFDGKHELPPESLLIELGRL